MVEKAPIYWNVHRVSNVPTATRRAARYAARSAGPRCTYKIAGHGNRDCRAVRIGGSMVLHHDDEVQQGTTADIGIKVSDRNGEINPTLGVSIRGAVIADVRIRRPCWYRD